MDEKRFVVQEHTTPEGVHWDLMLENGDVLKTFRLSGPPEIALERPLRAEPIFDHPTRFLMYEGPVQKGTGRVRIVDRGRYDERSRTETRWELFFDGAVLKGDFSLAQIEHDEWQFAHE